MRGLRLALLVVFVAASAARGWEKNGHRIVAEIADRHLEPSVKREIRTLIGNESLAKISTWADEIRSDSSWDCAKPFHFVTLPPSTAYLENGLPDADEGDALRAVFYYAEVLADHAGEPADRALALRLLVHFVGDLHQPLHLNLGCDLGGNRVGVSWFGRATNLHAVWDLRRPHFEAPRRAAAQGRPTARRPARLASGQETGAAARLP